MSYEFSACSIISEQEIITLTEADKILAKAAKVLADKTAEEGRLSEQQKKKEKLDRVLQTKEKPKVEKPVKYTKEGGSKLQKPLIEKAKTVAPRPLSSSSQKGTQAKTVSVPTYKNAPFRTETETKRRVLKAHNTKTSLARQKLTKSATASTSKTTIIDHHQPKPSVLLSIRDADEKKSTCKDNSSNTSSIQNSTSDVHKVTEKVKNIEIERNPKRFNLEKEG